MGGAGGLRRRLRRHAVDDGGDHQAADDRLIGLSASTQFMVTALVLLAAATVDAVARRNTVKR